MSESRVVAGAAVLSASASMPLHLLPILVLALSADGRLDPARAGWVGSVYMIGQLGIALALPLAQVQRVRWAAACATVLGTLLAAWLSVRARAPMLLAAWLVIGCLGGLLHYLATTTAAASVDRRFAFAVRLGLSSGLGSCLILGLQIFRPKADYGSVVMLYLVLTAIVGGVGLALLAGKARGSNPVGANATDHSSPAPRASAMLLAGLGMLFCLFVGQHGLWAFAVKGASARGLPVAQLLWAVALCKMGGAAVVFATARTGLGTPGASMRWPGAAVAAGGAIIAFTGEMVSYWLGLLLWEIGLNVLSARLQAALAQQDPQRAGMWITAAIFLGAAAGPALAGVALGAGAFGPFAVFAVATALAPAVWASRANATPAAPALERAR